MTYTNRPGEGYADTAAGGPGTEYHDRVRWGPVFGGFFIAVGLELVLAALGLALGVFTFANLATPLNQANAVSIAVGIWTIVTVFIALFLGGFVTARASGPISRKSAILNGAVLWGLTIVIGSYLVSSGVTGAFGTVVSSLGNLAAPLVGQAVGPGQLSVPGVTPPNVSAQELKIVAGNVAALNGWFAIACLVGFLSAVIGCAMGVRNNRARG